MAKDLESETVAFPTELLRKVRSWDESPSALAQLLAHYYQVFESLFERCADAICLFDPQARVLVDCNEAAVELIGGKNKQQVLSARQDEIAPPFQPDGTPSSQKAAQISAIIERDKRHRFEWTIRRFDGQDVPVEVSSTALIMAGKIIHVVVSRDISERKKAEEQKKVERETQTQILERRVIERTEALTTSEARFRALVEHAPEAIVLFDGDTGRLLFGNQHASNLFGVPMEKLPGLTPVDVSPPFQPGAIPSHELARQKMDEALGGGMPVFDWIHQQPGGRLIPTEVRLLRLPAEGQNLIRASIIDNTERKRAECQLRESESKFRALFEGSSQGVVLHDENEILEVNSAAVRIMGRQSPSELLGKHPRDLAPPLQPNGDSSAVVARRYIDECLTRGSTRFEWMGNSPQGREIPLEVTLTRIEWSGRQIIQALVTDITERKKSEAELKASEARLRESEARFSIAFQASPMFINILRISDSKYVWANDAFVNRLGYSREEVLGKTSAEFGMWESPAERDRAWRDMHAVGSIRQRECRWLNRQGTALTILLSAETIQFNDEPHVLSLALDITHRKRIEVELLKTLEREKELSQLKSNFVSMVSHEFRTPLGIIQSSGELLRGFYQKMHAAEREEQLDSITKNTRKMAGMMEAILVLSRLDAGKLEFHPAPLDLEAFCRRVVDEVLSATHGRCSIHLSVPSALAWASADERLLGHIFTNLLSNAVKYSDAGAAVEFNVDREDENALCVIRDPGIGISEEDQNQLFTPFHRGANVGSRSGTGLGLVLVKRCVELHRGQIKIQSAIAKGTTVTVRLPAFT